MTETSTEEQEALNKAKDIVEDVMKDALEGGAKSLILPKSYVPDVQDAAKKTKQCVELVETAEPHRGTMTGAIVGTAAGGVGGAAVATALVFPPLIPVVAVGAFLGFRWGSKR